MFRGVKRVPIPIVLILWAGAIAVPWWYGTRGVDFMEPPNEFQLAHVRYKTAAAFPKRDPLFPPKSEQQTRAFQSPIKAPPVIHPGNAHAPAELDEYREHAGEGAAAFVELAAHLEEQSGSARALLAWERVLDSCQPDEAQRLAAVSGIKRLRPLVAPWNIDPEVAIPMVLEASLPKGAATEGLEEILAACATVLDRKSSGLLHVTSRIEKLEKKPDAGPMISLQIIAGGESAASTGVIDLPVSADAARIRRDILSAAYKLVASQLAAATDFTPPEPLADGDDPESALGHRITRLCWREFGKSLHPADRP